MLKNRLSVLLAERELTAAKVYEDTGISRSTLSSLVNNSGDGVQYKTLDTLCNYLGVTPSDFFDFAPFILKYSYYTPDYRKEPLDSSLEDLDIFGEGRYYIELLVTKGQKQYKYILGVNVFCLESHADESNATNEYDVEIVLEDNYNGKSFNDEVFKNVPISFQIQIRNEFFEIIKIVSKDIVDYATVKGKKMKVFVQTPFGDTNFSIEQDKMDKKILEKKYGKSIINRWKKNNN